MVTALIVGSPLRLCPQGIADFHTAASTMGKGPVSLVCLGEITVSHRKFWNLEQIRIFGGESWATFRRKGQRLEAIQSDHREDVRGKHGVGVGQEL